TGEMVHFRLHNRHAAGRYSLGLAGIELVSHADVKSAGDHSYVLDRGVRVRRNFEVRWELNAEGERHFLIQRSLNDGNLRAGWKRRHVSPLKIRRRNKLVSLRRICWRDQEDAKSAQKCGCYCNVFHSFPPWLSEIRRTQTSHRTQTDPRFTSRQFAFTPVALTKAAFMLSSFLICASSSAGVKTSGSTPIIASFSCTVGTCMAFNVAR